MRFFDATFWQGVTMVGPVSGVEVGIFALLSLVATITNIAFAVFVYLENPKGILNRLWSFVILCLVLWGCGEFVMRVTTDSVVADVANRVSGIGFCLLPSAFLHFALAFTEQHVLLARRWIFPVLYGPGAAFSLLQLASPSEFAGRVTTTVLLSYGFSSTPGPAFWAFIIWLEMCFLAGLYHCHRRFRTARTKRERQQALYVVLGVSIPLLIGSITDAFLPLAGIETLRVAVLTTTVTAALVGYAVVKFRLMSLTPQATANTILNTMGDLLAVTDVEGRVVFTNELFRKTAFSKSGGECTSSNIREFIEDASTPSPHDPNVRTQDQRLETWTRTPRVREGTPVTTPLKDKRNFSSTSLVSVEARFKPSRGESFPILLTVSPMHDGGEYVGHIFLARDITERKQAEEALRESEAKFRWLFQNVPDGVYVSTPDGRLLVVNEALVRMLGYSSTEELLAADVRRDLYVNPEERTLWIEKLEASGRLHGAELHLKRKDGNTLTVIENAHLVTDAQGMVYYEGTLTDITEQKILQQQLEETARQRKEDLEHFAVSLQRAQEEERRRVARELHDDLGQQLTGMRLSLDVFENDVPRTNRKMIRKLGDLKRQIDRMIVEIRRISGNLRPTALDDFGLVVALQLLCRTFAKVHRVKISYQASNSPTARYPAHAEIALYRIAQEALSNVVRHAKASNVLIQLSEREKNLLLDIEDDGRGFVLEEGRARSDLSAQGMGLISMRERAELLGGAFRIESVPGQGTHIAVEVPV